MPLQFRRGTNAERLTITPAVGEPIWTTNTNLLYVGDGTTVGGVRIELPLPSTATFATLTVTNLHFSGDPVGVDQTTAWTGTVAWSEIGSKPNGGLYTTSTVEFSQLSVTGSTIANTQSSILINASGSTVYEPPHASGYGLWAINKVGSSARIVTDAYTAASAGAGSVWTGRKARGTASAPTAVQSGDLILRIAGTGFGTTEFESTSSAYMEVVALENMTDGAHGTKINFVTTNVGSNSQSTPLVLKSDGTIITAPDASATESVLLINKTGLTSYPAPVNVDGYDLWAIREGESARGVLDAYGTGVAPNWQGRRARGTAASPTAVQLDDVMVSLRGNGYGATQFAQTSTGIINISATENFTDTARGTRILFAVVPQGQVDTALVATMRADGMFVYTTATTGNGMLTVNGSYPNQTYEAAYDGTNIQTINIPGNPGRILIDTYADTLANSTDKSYLQGRRARGTADAPSAVLANDGILRLAAYPYGTTGFLNTASAGIQFVALENITDSAGGGKITFDVQTLGSVSTTTQVTAMTLTAADGATVDQLNVNNLTINNAGEILSTTASDIDLYTNNATSNFSEVWLKHNDGVYILADGATTYQWSFNKSGQLTFPDSTIQNTAWTGSVSTSSVTGLATVAWTGKYSDLTGEPNQALDTTSTVQFAGITNTGNLSVTGFSSLNGGATISAATVTNALSVGTNLTAGATTLQSLSVTTGSVFNKTVSIGGAPLNSAGTSSFIYSSGVSPIAVFSNYVSGSIPSIYVRGYGGNNPGGGQPNNRLTVDGSRGTVASPTAIQASDNLFTLLPYGYDGANWGSEQNTTGYNVLGFSASENMTSTGTTTLQAGSNFFIFTQPAWTRPGTTGVSRQRIMLTSWTTASGGPSQLNMNFGSSADSTTATHTMVDGTTYIGPGRTTMNFVNVLSNFFGVPSQDTTADNITLTATNFINLVASRRNSTSGRRNAISSGDTIYSINFRGQNSNNATGNGVIGANITATALETYAAGAYGTSLSINTVNSGTTVNASRAFFSDRISKFTADQFQFANGGNTKIPISFTTATWNSSIDTMTFGDNTGLLTPLKLEVAAATNSYYNTTHSFRDKTGTVNALVITTGSVTISAPTINFSNSTMTVPTTTGISGTGTVIVGGFDTAVYTAGKFVVTIKDSTNVQTSEVLLTSNGSSTANTVFGTVTVGTGVLGTFSSTLSGAQAQLIFTPTGATSMTVKASLTTI